MKAKNINKLLKRNGKTADIATAVMQVYNNDYQQANELAKSLVGNSTEQTCEKIFNYVIEHVKYIEDPNGVQWVKTPARLLADGSGDCKSMAIFIGSCLRCLGIQHVVRFVSYSQQKEATHVYIVVTDGGSELVVDPVVRVDDLPKFNYEEKYTFKSDMSGTNIYYMAGIRKGAIGSATIDETDRYKVWIGDEKEFGITPGKHFLYAKFDLALEMINISTSEKEKALYFNELDIYASLLHAYNHVNGDTEMFSRMVHIICGLSHERFFVSTITDENSRADNLDELFAEIDRRFDNNIFPDIYDGSLWDLISKEVLANNEMKAQISGGSAAEFQALEQMKRSGIFFLYRFIPQAQINTFPSVIAKKQGIQGGVFNWAAERNTIQTPTTMELTYRAGVIARTGKTPERYLEDKKNKAAGIGFDPVTIMAVITLIGALVKLFQQIFPKKYKYSDPTNSEMESGSFDPLSDFNMSNSVNNNGNLNSGFFEKYGLQLALGAGLLLLILKKRD